VVDSLLPQYYPAATGLWPTGMPLGGQMINQPFPETADRDLRRVQREEALAALDSLAEKISRSWRSPKSAVELVQEQRR
jgi:hypothetical protein